MDGKRGKEERNKHLREMEKLLISGVGAAEVADLAVESYGISLRHAYRDLKVIRKRFSKADELIRAAKHSAVSLLFASRRRDDLYRRLVQEGKLLDALTVEQDRCNLLGIYEDVQKRVADLERRAANAGRLGGDAGLPDGANGHTNDSG